MVVTAWSWMALALVLALSVGYSCEAFGNGAVPWATTTKRRRVRQPPKEILHSTPKDGTGDNSDITEEPPVEYRTISDYMGGHHAGKFDFDPRICGVTALNYEKSIVFDDATSSQATNLLAPLEDLEARPKWSLRPVDVTATQGTVRVLEAGAGDDDNTSVLVKNAEISWEPFYATVETTAAPGGQASQEESFMGLEVSPSTGNLAPRGGSEPYTDQATLCVTRSSAEESSFPFLSETSSYYLVVRTEQNYWSWRILVE